MNLSEFGVNVVVDCIPPSTSPTPGIFIGGLETKNFREQFIFVVVSCVIVCLDSDFFDCDHL